MSCFCSANLDLLPLLDLDVSLNFNFTARAQAALDFYAQISLGLPDFPLPPPPFELPQLDLSLGALVSLTAMLQLQAQLDQLGIDLTAELGLTPLERLTTTLAARSEDIAGQRLNLKPWIRLAQINAVALELTAIFEACLSASASLSFNMVVPPPSWGGLNLTVLTTLARLNVSLDVEAVASLEALAQAVASITVEPPPPELVAGSAAIAQLASSLGDNPLRMGLPAVRARVAANFTAMLSVAARLGIDFSLPLPPLPSIPGFTAALVASFTAQLELAIGIAVALSMVASFDVQLSISLLLAISLCVSLSASLGINVALAAPCTGCDLRTIMAAVPPPAPGSPAPGSTSSSCAGSSQSPGATPGVAPSALAAVTGAAGSGAAGGGAGGGGVPATVMTAQLMCTMGMAPSMLSVLPVNRTMVGHQVAANIMDHVPMVNILPFGLCMSPLNPTVAAATAAALGVLTPMPCIPATASPWVAGAPTVMLGRQPMLNCTSKCMCNWAGVVSIISPGQIQTTIP